MKQFMKAFDKSFEFSKFLRAEHAFELTPYSCAIDKHVSELMGWGSTRLKTIAENFSRCEFRFKSGGETRVVILQSLQAGRI